MAVLVQPASGKNNGRCRTGPYVWQANTHHEGIGSVFPHYRRGLLLADALRATWVGRLENSHDHPQRLNNAAFFGLQKNDCMVEDMQRLRHDSDDEKVSMEFRSVSKEMLPPISELCRSLVGGKHEFLRLALNVSQRTVLVLNNDDDSIPDWNLCTFNHYFRERYQKVRSSRCKHAQDNNLPAGLHYLCKPEDEIWISAHFRWGDTATGDVEHPNNRNMGSLHDLVRSVQKHYQILSSEHKEYWWLWRGPQRRRVVVHFLSEGDAAEFEEFTSAFPQAVLHLNATLWREALDTLSESDVVIGGKSSFFVLGAFLCDAPCVVVAPHVHKFWIHPIEWTEGRRLHFDFRARWGHGRDIPLPPSRAFQRFVGTLAVTTVVVLWVMFKLVKRWYHPNMPTMTGHDTTCLQQEHKALISHRASEELELTELTRE